MSLNTVHFRSNTTWQECSVEGCDHPTYMRGWCTAHYQRWSQTGDVQVRKPTKTVRPKPCAVESCVHVAVALGYCKTHAGRWYTAGDVRAETPIAEINKYENVTCSQRGCDKQAVAGATARGAFCQNHYAAFKRRGMVLCAIASAGGACLDCGGKFSVQVFDFHHRDPATKSFRVAQAMRHGSSAQLDRCLEEVKKCDLLCANCHRLRHAITRRIA
jgi:hypothetical protein